MGKEKERNFEQEINSIRLRTGSIINWNYWRIDGIKNIYDVFQKEVSEKFEKDLSEYKLEEADFEIENYSDDEEDDEYNNIDDILEYNIKTNNRNSQVKSKVRNQLLEEDIEQVDDYNEYEDDDEDDYDEEDNKNNAYYKIMEQRKNSYFKNIDNIDNNDDEQEIEEETDLEIPEIKQPKYEIDEYFDDDDDEEDNIEHEEDDEEEYDNQEDYDDDEDDDDEYYEYDDDEDDDEENEGIYDIIKNSINKLEEDEDSKGLFNKFFKR